MSRARRIWIGLLLGLWLATPSAAEPAGPKSAEAAVQEADLEAARLPIETLYEAMLACMQQAEALGFDGRREMMGPALETAYDFDFMAAKALGRHWRALDDEQKQLWRKVFADMTVATYASRFNGYSGERLDVNSSEASTRGTVVVRTEIVPPGDEPVTINYRMRSRGGAWKAIDVYLNGTVSELALRRSEYSSALKREGFETLVASLREKTQNGGL